MSFLKKIKKMFLKEATLESVYGTPVDFNKYYTNGQIPLMGGLSYNKELYPDRSTTIRSEQQLNIVRQYCRLLYETNPNATAVINGLCNYVIGGGLTIKIKAKEKANVARLVKQVQILVDEFAEVNNLEMLYDDIYIRYHKDGEAFIRLFPQDGPTLIRTIEPDHIQTPNGESVTGPWAYGIQTDPLDYYNIKAYCFSPAPDYSEIVEAHYIHHLKNNATNICKRGLSSLYAVMDELNGSDKLREAILHGERIRNAIAYIRQFATAPKSSVQAMNAESESYEWNVPLVNGGGVKQINNGEVVDIPKGMEFVPPPTSPNTVIAQDIINASLSSIAARFQCPNWLISGAVEGSSYASSITAESPFVHTCIRQQKIVCAFWKSIIKDIIEIEMAKGNLGEDTFNKIEIVVSAPSPTSRASKEQVDSQIALVKERVMSKATLSILNNLNPEEEKTMIEDELKDPIYQNQTDDTEEETPQTMSGQMGKELPQVE